jgi:hypothetical protein
MSLGVNDITFRTIADLATPLLPPRSDLIEQKLQQASYVSGIPMRYFRYCRSPFGSLGEQAALFYRALRKLVYKRPKPAVS